MVAFVKKCAQLCLRQFGLKITRLDSMASYEPIATFAYRGLISFRNATAPIPGMVSIESAELLYSLCLMQGLRGDILEIGSWQGKSTSYLARAAKDSANGRVFAVDHFKGNVGKENMYRVGNSAATSIYDMFNKNIYSLGLDDVVAAVPLSSKAAHAQLCGRTFRFIFIDGDHTYEGVSEDIKLFSPLLQPGGIMAFDDFDSTFPGLVKAVSEWVARAKPSAIFSLRNMLICKL